MKNTINIWIYSIAVISTLINAWFAYKSGNIESAGSWLISTGLACGALGAFLELRDKDKKEDGE